MINGSVAGKKGKERGRKTESK